jgi:predicted HicB family RNase H-like nuclease
MAYSEAQKKATAKYMKNKLDDIKVRVPKGKREVYKAHAERKGKSLNALIIELLEKDMQEEN